MINRWTFRDTSRLSSLTTQTISTLGLTLCVLSAIFLVCNQYTTLSTLNPYYRIHTAGICLILGLVTSLISARLAVMVCAFLLPLLPTFAKQFQLYTGYGRIQDSPHAGLDIVAGIFCGVVIAHLFKRQLPLREKISLPWPAGLVMIVMSVSVVTAIVRNLHQTDAPFSLQALLFNFINLRSLSWHDDYRPLMDWVAYGHALLLIAVIGPALQRMPDRNDVVFKPLIAGLIIAALVGLRQALFGAGLSMDLQNFRVSRFGFAALGFQPDLHAFAGHMLIGALGLAGYAFHKKSSYTWMITLASTAMLCWILLFLSKSKASFALAVLVFSCALFVWLARHTKILKWILVSVVVLAMLVFASIPLYTELWTTIVSSTLKSLGLPDLSALNIKLSYRPEVYLAALRMFVLFPFAGLGQAEFYRQSANPDVSHSFFLSVEQNGENAHNYFLQTLVEKGLIGTAAFALLLLYPLFKVKDKRLLIPAIVALLAIFSGNIFAHSLLIRENLILAACFIALLYAWIPVSSPNSTAQLDATATISRSHGYVFICVVTVFVGLGVHEYFRATSSFPFNVDIQCHKKPSTLAKGWTSGRHWVEVPVGATGATFRLSDAQPDVDRRPLRMLIDVFYNHQKVSEQTVIFNTLGPQTFDVLLPAGTIATPDDYAIELTLSRCFVPRNFGINTDSRRLGVNIDSIQWH